MSKKVIFIISSLMGVLSLLLLRSANAAGYNGDPLSGPGAEKIAPTVQHAVLSPVPLSPGAGPSGMIKVIVTLKGQASLQVAPGLDPQARVSAVVERLQAEAAATQPAVTALLRQRESQGQARDVVSLWIINGYALEAPPALIEELAARADVASITLDADISAPSAQSAAYAATSLIPAPNLAAIHAPNVWALGYTGQNVVIASLDTGVDLRQPDLNGQYRGGADSWYDPYAVHATPVDLDGHGTWTMGVMVGRSDGSTPAMGVAPDARWIAARVFDDAGNASVSAIHLAYQWVLDPSGNPAEPDAPQVVNNSWGQATAGCDLTFQPDLQALLKAGILPVFAAGNTGPAAASAVSPADNPEAFAVGASDDANALWSSSARGPNPCGGSGGDFPRIVAPGVNIFTTGVVTGGQPTFVSATGTSLAAPHAAGAIALLLSAFPKMTLAQEETALTVSARPLGPATPNNDTGSGEMDVYAAFQWMAKQTAPLPPPKIAGAVFFPILFK